MSGVYFFSGFRSAVERKPRKAGLKMKTKKVPMRRCAGCMQSKQKRELIRIVGDKEGCVKLDVTGKAPGRGVYLCPDSGCFRIARKKQAISRNLGIKVPEEALDEIFEELKNYEKE